MTQPGYVNSSSTNELEKSSDWMDEIEAKTLQLETVNDLQATNILAQERKVENLSDHIDIKHTYF